MLEVLTPATTEPVTLAEAKAHLRVFQDSDDPLITRLIKAAREAVELEAGRCLAAAEYLWTPETVATPQLPLRPATVTSLDGERPIVFTTSPGVIPEALKSAVLLLVSDLYENTEANAATALHANPTLQNLIFKNRVNLGV
jgi:hypothetical protein